MPVLTRSLSVGSSNRPFLTPHTPPSTHPRSLIDMTPLPSFLDKVIEAARRSKRSTSLHLKSKVDDNRFALPSIPEDPESSPSDPVKVHDVMQPSDTPIKVEDEPEPVAHHPSATTDYMDFEDAPIVFSEPIHLNTPPVPIVLSPTPNTIFPVHEKVVTNFPPFNLFDCPGTPATPPHTDHDPLLLTELTNSATFPYHTTYYNPPSTSANVASNSSLQEQVPFQPPQVNEQPPQIQTANHNTVYPQYPTLPPPTHPTGSPALFASAPVQNIMQPAVLPTLTQSLPVFSAFPVYSDLNPQRQEKNLFHPPPVFAHPSCSRPMFAPQVQPPPELGNALAWWFYPRTRVPSWRIREIERQREMDRIAEPYIVRLREVSRQKKVDAEARALAGLQRTDRAKNESGNPSRYLFPEKKIQKGIKEIERQQRSEEKRQARRHRKSVESTPPGVQETKTSVSPRRRSSGRSKPYDIPHPATRSPRRLHVMPGGFDSDDLTSNQASLTSDVLWLWKGLRSAVDMGYELWVQD